jgi:hypothetical protein
VPRFRLVHTSAERRTTRSKILATCCARSIDGAISDEGDLITKGQRTIAGPRHGTPAGVRRTGGSRLIADAGTSGYFRL